MHVEDIRLFPKASQQQHTHGHAHIHTHLHRHTNPNASRIYLGLLLLILERIFAPRPQSVVVEVVNDWNLHLLHLRPLCAITRTEHTTFLHTHSHTHRSVLTRSTGRRLEQPLRPEHKLRISTSSCPSLLPFSNPTSTGLCDSLSPCVPSGRG